MRNLAHRILGPRRERLPEWSRPRIWASLGLAFVIALTLTALMLVDPRDPPELLLFVGRFHPMIVHFPIGLILLAGILEVLAVVYRPFRVLRHSTAVVLFLGALGSVAAVVAGYLLSLEGGYEPRLVRTHFWLGVTVATSAVAAAVLKIRAQRRHPRRLDRIYAVVLLTSVAALVLTGHVGASLTHGQGYLTRYLPAPLRSVLGPSEAQASRGRITDIDSAYVYRDLVMPALEARCTSCHNGSKVKGGLRLDSPEWMMKGGNDGAVIVAGSPEESELLRRITMSPDAEDAMPPGGAPPLDVGETELIRWWIANGASLEQRVADVEEIPTAVATHFNRVAPPRPEKKMGVYALEAAPADPRALAALSAAGYGIDRVAHDVELLRVTAVNLRSSVDDEEVKRLLPVAEQITWLDLAGTRVGNGGMAVVARMPNLTRLSLQRTAVGDEGMRQLAGLRNLEYLNLFGSAVGDAGVSQLHGLRGLKTVYLWQTRVSDEGVARLEAALPQLQVILGAPGQPSAGTAPQ